MDVVLALNRLKVFCRIRYRKVIDSALQTIIWLSGAVSFGITIAPLAGFKLASDEFELCADLSRPWTKHNGIYLSFVPIACSLVTLSIYIAVFMFLLYKKAKIGRINTNKAEIRLLAQALLRFCGDSCVEIVMFIMVNMTPGHTTSPYLRMFHYMGMVNFVCIPPVIFLVLNKSIRGHVVKFRDTSSVQVAPLMRLV
uniref:G_PROTEIN_RECEP_F1_2 domain-containing protein n=1 Tax=Steinernema glaseri TaxID=37863 RepID=A0A1I8A481_9BILA